MDKVGYSDIDQRVEEIKNLVLDDNINRATNRTLDFTNEFTADKKIKNEAIIIRQKFKELSSDKRLLGYNNGFEQRQTKFIKHILDFVDSVADSYKESKTKKETLQKTNIDLEVQKKVKKRRIKKGQGGESINDEKFEKKTRLEKKKKEFLGNKDNTKKIEGEEFICTAQNIQKQYPKNKNFKLSDISLKLKLREITGVVGENGSGKTTLLKIIAGELAEDEGELKYPILNKGELDWYCVKQQMAYIPQQLHAWEGALKDNLHFSASTHGIKGKTNLEEVEFLAYRLDLEEYLNLDWDEISGGYKTRFELARMLVWKPKLLVLDEPLANLDINAQIIFLQDLRDLANSTKNPISIFVSSQHLHEIESIADNVMFLEDGRVKYYGKIDDLGKKREMNSFEVVGKHNEEKLTRDILFNVFCDMDIIDIEDVDLSLIIHTSIEIKTEDILKKLLGDSKIEVKYFRNISTSTRSLFRKKY